MKPAISITFLCALFAAMCTQAYAQDAKTNIKNAYELLNKRDYAAFAKICAPEFTEYAAGPEPIKTAEAAIEAYKQYFAAFPDLKFTVHDITKGDNGKYYVHLTTIGTNTGSFWMLPATNKKVTVDEIDVIEVNSKGLATSHRSGDPNQMLRAIGYGSLDNPNTAIIMSAYEKFGKGDLEGILALHADDAVYEIHDLSISPNPEVYNGTDGVSEFFKTIMSKVEYSKFQPWRFVADGDDVFVLVSAEFKDLATGKMVSTNYTHHFTLSDGKIRHWKGVADIEKAYDPTLAEQNTKTLFDLMDAGNTEMFKKYCTADFMIMNPFLPSEAPISAFEEILKVQKTAFPDMKHEILQFTTDGHFATTRGIFRGTNTGPMMGNPPGGNKVELPFLVLDEFDANGMLKNRFVQFDVKSFESQLMAGK